MHPLFFLSLSQENLFKFNTVLFKIIKDKVMAFADIFKDTNDYNEKTIIGFLSFAVMVLVMIAVCQEASTKLFVGLQFLHCQNIFPTESHFYPIGNVLRSYCDNQNPVFFSLLLVS